MDLESSDICITIFSQQILPLSDFSYNINNYHVLTAVLEEVSLKTRTGSAPKRNMLSFHNIR
jgi:hypothetical protein